MSWDESLVVELVTRGERYEITRLQAELAHEFAVLEGSFWELLESRTLEFREWQKARARERSCRNYRRRESVLVAIQRAKRVASTRCRCCGGPVPDAHKGQRNRYCGLLCRRRGNNATRSVQVNAARKAVLEAASCQVCGGPVSKPHHGPVPRYCSPACRNRAYRARKK